MKTNKITLEFLKAVSASEYVIDFVERNKLDGLPVEFLYGTDQGKKEPWLQELKEIFKKEYEFDEKGRLISLSIPDKGTQISYEYNEHGISREVINGKVHDYTYDEKGRIVQRNFNGTVEITQYDQNGNKVKVTYHYPDISGKKSVAMYEYKYDEHGRLIKQFCNGELIYECQYDEKGNISREVTYGDEEDDYWVEYERDERGNPIKEVTSEGVWLYEYDDRDNHIKTVFPDGLVTETILDQAGNVVGELIDGEVIYEVSTEFYDNGQLKRFGTLEFPKIK